VSFPYSAKLTPRRAGLAAGGGAFVALMVVGEGLISALVFGGVMGAVGFLSVRHGQRDASQAGDT
jgi:hypothetical protein